MFSRTMLCAIEPSSTQNQRWPQYITAFSLFIVVFASGIHLGWPSPSTPKLIHDSTLNITSDDASYIATISSLAQIGGNIVASVLIDRIGRKTTLLCTAPLFLLSMILIHFYSSVGMLYAARVIGGFAEGGSIIVAPVYIAEITEPKIRGMLSSMYMVFWSGGLLYINLVGFYCSIETAALACMPFSVIFIAVFIFMPQSPYYLLMKDRPQEAKKCLEMLRWNRNVDEEFSLLQKDVDRQTSERGRLQDLVLVKSNRFAITILSVLTVIQVFSGLPALTMYAQTFFSQATDALPQQWAAVLMQVLKLITMFVGASIIDIVGRRILILISSFCCFVTLTGISIFFFLRDYTSLRVDDFNWLALVGMCLFVISFMMGLGIAALCLKGELFGASVKGKAVCVVSVLSAACEFGSTKLYQVMSDEYTPGAPIALFAVVQILGFEFCRRFVLETKKKSLEEIQQELKSKKI